MKRLSLLLLVVLCSFSLSAWDSTEKRLIGEAHYGLMRTYTIASNADSLFLRKKAKHVSRKEISQLPFAQLVCGMLYTVTHPSQEGVGIAAPQVGIGRRIIAVQRFDKQGEPFEVLVNPEILSFGGEMKGEMEGCLSLPDRFGSVCRPQEILVRYNDPIHFSLITERISGFTAVIIQHEIDHLEGILFIDRLQ